MHAHLTIGFQQFSIALFILEGKKPQHSKTLQQEIQNFFCQLEKAGIQWSS